MKVTCWTVSVAGARFTAPNPLGVMHGLQTFLQLVEVTPEGFAAPAVHIEDTAAFPWRGLMIDVSRHFIPMDVLKRNVDGMAAVKMNVLHLHLSDDQGFRVESKEFPKLQEMGSDGMYYTQAEVRELIEYARDRGIRVVPEFDMPGHSTAWFVGYPELASGPGPYRSSGAGEFSIRRWIPTREETYKFLDKFIGEMAELFPDQYFHIGGDEVNGKQWDANPKIQEFMRAHGIKNDQELQQYFTVRVEKIVSKHHKKMVGWDEILSAGDAERYRDSIVARAEIVGRSGAAGISRNAFKRLLPGSAWLRRRSITRWIRWRSETASLTPEDRNRFWAAKLACGRNLCRRKTSIRESGRGQRRWRNGCGRRRKCGIWIRCTGG